MIIEFRAKSSLIFCFIFTRIRNDLFKSWKGGKNLSLAWMQGKMNLKI